MKRKMIVMTSIAFNRGGDIGAAKNFVNWWKKQESSVDARLVVQYDLTSLKRAEGLRAYAEHNGITVDIYPAKHVTTENLEKSSSEQLVEDKNYASLGMTAFDDKKFKADVFENDNTAGIVCIPNWHRVPERLLDYLCHKQNKPFFPISEYNLLPDYGNLKTRRSVIADAIEGGASHIRAIEMGFGQGPSAISGPKITSPKAGVFVPSAKKVIESEDVRNHKISQLLSIDGNATYMGYFFQESLRDSEGEGRTSP